MTYVRQLVVVAVLTAVVATLAGWLLVWMPRRVRWERERMVRKGDE